MIVSILVPTHVGTIKMLEPTHVCTITTLEPTQFWYYHNVSTNDVGINTILRMYKECTENILRMFFIIY